MPSKSEKQKKLFQWVKAVQEGKAKGQGKIKELAETMSPQDVKDFADYLESEKTTDSIKSANQNLTKLTQYALISALVGGSLAGAYGLSKNHSDRKNNVKKIEKLKAEMDKAKNTNIPQKVLDEAAPIIEDTPDLYLVDQNEEEKFSSFNKAAFTGNKYVDPVIYGAATPVAMIAPALLAYHFTKKYMDRGRNNNLSEELEKAKKEFEAILSQKTSALQEEVDNLFLTYKQAATKSGTVVQGNNVYDDNGAPIDVLYKPGLSLSGLLYGGGALAGLSGLAAYMLADKRLGEDPEVEKAKAFEKVLKKNLSAEALQSGINIIETPQGKKIVNLG
jgi:hypothetical protein